MREDDAIGDWALKVIFILLMTVLICNVLCSCKIEKEVYASISIGKVVKVEERRNGRLVSVKDMGDSIIYTDCWSKFPFNVIIPGQMIWIIVKR